MTSRFSALALAIFELFFRPWMRRRLRAVHLAGLPERLPPGPLLLVANHSSWWDAFLLREVQRAIRPRAPVFTVMLRSELERHPFFRLVGGVGIEPPRPTSVAHAVTGLERRRREDDLVLLFFPQGRIWPSYRRPLDFRRGLDLFAARLSPATVLPVALHLEPLTGSAPTAFVVAGAPLPVGGEGPVAVAVEGAVTRQLDDLLEFLARHGEAAPAHWPQPFQPLPAHRAAAVPVPPP